MKEKSTLDLIWYDSKTSAERLALLEVLQMAVYYKTLLAGTSATKTNQIPVAAFIDKNIVEALHSTKLVDDNQLGLDIAALCKVQCNNFVTVKWWPEKNQMVNPLKIQGASSNS